jgi:hypothetical protein
MIRTLVPVLAVATLTLSLPACEGDPAPGNPFTGDHFATEMAPREAALAEACAAFCDAQLACGLADDVGACADDCRFGDLAVADEEPVPAGCEETYVDAIDCLAAPACGEADVCDLAVQSHADCKADRLRAD